MPPPLPDDVLLRSDTARSMFPGQALDDAPPDETPAQERTPLDRLLLVAHLQRYLALPRVKKWPGSGDTVFLATVRALRPELLTRQQVARLVFLAWRYRAQLPAGLRPHAQPADDGLT